MRLSLGLTQKQLGAKIGLSESGINEIEKGRNKTTLDKAIILADFFKISLDELVGRKIPEN